MNGNERLHVKKTKTKFEIEGLSKYTDGEIHFQKRGRKELTVALRDTSGKKQEFIMGWIDWETALDLAEWITDGPLVTRRPEPIFHNEYHRRMRDFRLALSRARSAIKEMSAIADDHRLEDDVAKTNDFPTSLRSREDLEEF